MVIPLGRQLLAASSSLPGSRNEPDRLCFLFGLAPGGVCQARRVTPPAGALLPHRFTLAGGAVNLQHMLVTVGGSSGGCVLCVLDGSAFSALALWNLNDVTVTGGGVAVRFDGGHYA